MLRNKPSGINGIQQTHCRKNHEFTPENTIVRKNGQRLCRTCRNENGRLWAQRCLDKSSIASRKRHLKGTYGISIEKFDSILVEQLGLCAICGDQMRDPQVDHCHYTNSVRGLLCRMCNIGLGNFRDEAIYLENAIAYLSKEHNHAPL